MKQSNNVGEIPFQSVRVGDLNNDSGDELTIDIRDILHKLWRGKWIIGVTTLIASVFAFLTISQMEPRYLASTKVMFDLQNRNVVNVDQLVVSSAISENSLQNEIEILSSTKLIENVIEKLHLDRNPQFNPYLRARQATLLDKIRDLVTIPPEVLDLAKDIGIVAPTPPPPDAAELEARATLAASRQRLVINSIVLSGLRLTPIRGSKVIQISYTSGDPNTSAMIANTISEEYIIGQLDAKLEATRSATNWLTSRVDELRDRVQFAEEAVEIKRAEQSIRAGQSLEITRQQLNSLTSSLSSARNQTTVARALYDRLQSAVNNGRDFGAIPEFRSSAIIQQLRQQESDLLSQQIGLSENSPVFIHLASQLRDTRRKINQEALRIVEAAHSSWVSALSQENAMERDVRETETKALDQSREEVEIRQLEREAQAGRVLYENFLSRLKETSEQDELQSADARILSRAEPPLSALFQAKQRILLMALALGLALGVGIVFLMDKLNNTFRAPLQVETLTGETVLGTIPAVGRRLHRRDVIRHFRSNPKSSLAESIRSLRTSILFSNVDKPPKVVMFTSSVPREAKSTTSMLVAMTSQQMGKSAIIVDCDLRLPSLARLLNADDGKPGLLSVIDGTAELDEAIFLDPETGLHVLMTKPSEPRSNLNAADILSSRKFNEILAALKNRYDLVILDTPPALIVADARILAAHADAVVYAIRWDHTPRGAVLEGLKELKSVNAPIAGVVLSLVNEARATKYAYDGYAYYKGRYKDYYVS